MTTELTAAEEAATKVVAILGDTCTDLGLAKWQLVASRIRVAAARAETGPDVWAQVAPHLRALGAHDMPKASAADLLEALDTPGVLDELRERLDLAVLRVRVTRRPKTVTTEEDL